MNYYKHHIGDYAAATAHLSILEDGAYSRLLRIYYRDEGPLPADVKAVQRLAGARTREEREAVEVVLNEFFDLCDDGWRNKRADEEVERMQAQAAANRKVAREREARRRSTRNPRNVERTEHESCDESFGGREPSHKPLATSHEVPDTSLSLTTPEPGNGVERARHSNGSPPITPTAAGLACRLMREAGCARTNPSHADLLAALAEGVTPEVLADTAREAVESGKTAAFAWSIATARSRHREGPRAIATLPARQTPQGPQSRTGQGIAALEALKRHGT